MLIFNTPTKKYKHEKLETRIHFSSRLLAAHEITSYTSEEIDI